MSTLLQPGDALAVVGNPRPASRTLAIAAHTVHAVTTVLGAPPGTGEVIDLAATAERLGAPLGADAGQRWAPPLARLRAARLVVVACPVYKGSYPGLLKAFLDLVETGALAGTVAVPLITPAGPAHALAADVHLRPLLIELGAGVPTASLVVTAAALDDPVPVIETWLARSEPVLRALLAPSAPSLPPATLPAAPTLPAAAATGAHR